MPLTLRPITTPSSNPALFKENQRRAQEARKAELGLISPSTKGMMKPGGEHFDPNCVYQKLICLVAGFEGPNIYVRTLQGLRSQVPEEQDYALHHLVKISHERGDKYKFDAFPNLAEGLIEYALGVSSLFYDVTWEISYSEDEHEVNILDGIKGTPDILQRIECLKRIDTPDELESEQFARKITKIHEAGLTIRNLALLEDNALYLSEMPQVRDFLSIALNLPPLPIITELKHYALDISEQITRYWCMDESDPLYRSLLSQVDDGHDRGAILTALRAIIRISMNLEDSNLLKGVPVSVVRRICEWILLEDEELVGVCLDFLYQFTAVPYNVSLLLSNSHEIPLSSLFGQLARLLQYHARTSTATQVASKAIPSPPATEVPNVPRDLLEQFLKLDEPHRSNNWLKAVFEEDAESYITQIALWQAYQARFTEFATAQIQLLPAAEFIKNVSSIFTTANAQVISGEQPKFIIKGIRPRHAPVDGKGRPYTRCQWKAPGSNQCQEFFGKARYIFEHIASSHLGITRNQGGTWDLNPNSHVEQPLLDCHWAGCQHFARTKSTPSSYKVGMHVKTHLADQSSKASWREKHNRTTATQTIPTSTQMNGHPASFANPIVDLEDGRQLTHRELMYQDTAVDELGNASGLPLTSVLVLRNLARNVPKAAALLEPDNLESFNQECMEKLFGPLKERFLFVMAHNRPLAGYVSDLKTLVERGYDS